jgi:hypothetical protein
MLLLTKSLYEQPILSLRSGGKVGIAHRPIINPRNLKIEGWFCHDIFIKQERVVLSQEIRELIPQGIVVNDHEAMTDPEDLIRLEALLTMRYELIGKPVYAGKQKVGKLSDYAVNSQDLYIQKIYVAQPLHKSLNGGELSFDRTQIVEITLNKVVVQTPEVRSGVSVVERFRQKTAEVASFTSTSNSLTKE